MSETIAARVRELTDQLHLAQEEVAAIVGASSRTVARWSGGHTTPQRDARNRLLELRYVAAAAADVIRPEDVSLWLFEPNEVLDGDTPADRIRTGRYRDVLAVLNALAEGVIV